MWAIFVYASMDERIRREQWEDLIQKREQWGRKLGDQRGGGDFNDIRTSDEKKGERQKSEANLRGFNDFVSKMEMEKI